MTEKTKIKQKQIHRTPKSERPAIEINMSPVHEAYLRWIFKTPKNERKIEINRTQDVGKHIFSHVKTSDHPRHRPIKTNLVVIILPMPGNAWLQLKSNFIFIDDWAEMKISDYIESEFNLWCREKFLKGYIWGWTQKQITDAILRGLNLRDNEANEAAIIKNDYRWRRKVEEIRFKALQETEY